MAVVIPVHNEEDLLADALEGVSGAVARLQALRPRIRVRVMAVLDSCTDGSAAIATDFAARTSWLSTLEVDFRNVGRTRRAGIWSVLGGAADGPPEAASSLWVANTDADSRVPENWLAVQAAMADAGADAVLGSVELDSAGTSPDVIRRWLRHHPFREEHPHVYGANFGVRASAYLWAGGFPRYLSHEDRILAERLRSMGFAVRATDTIRVLTSGRTQARAPHGFGFYLQRLGVDASLATEG
jgi:glycosyltransferase involved in cell wall biosynthesis